MQIAAITKIPLVGSAILTKDTQISTYSGREGVGLDIDRCKRYVLRISSYIANYYLTWLNINCANIHLAASAVAMEQQFLASNRQ